MDYIFSKKRGFQNTLLIAIHGRGTEGYEWVYPLINLDKKIIDYPFTDGILLDVLMSNKKDLIRN